MLGKLQKVKCPTFFGRSGEAAPSSSSSVGRALRVKVMSIGWAPQLAHGQGRQVSNAKRWKRQTFSRLQFSSWMFGTC